MKQKIRLSIIIPVYNVENYIARCLDSVLNQSFETIEIICVNDGSPDDSRKIISDYISKNNNVKCIDRSNGGLSAARNTGIMEAQGEYLLFLDSDDWLEKNVLDNLYNCAQKENLDVLICNTQWVYSDYINKPEELSSDIIPSKIDGETALIKLMDTGSYEPMAYNYVVKREFLLINNLLFKEGLLFEDELWTPQLLLRAQNVKGTEIVHYNYYQRQNTIMNSAPNTNKVDSYAYIAQELIKIGNKGQAKLRQNLWFRACVLYFHKCKTQEKLDGYKNNYKISWMSLLNASSNYFTFYKSFDFLDYPKYQRRIIKLIAKIYLSSYKKLNLTVNQKLNYHKAVHCL